MADFAILRTGETLLQIHAASTYRDNPLLGLVPEMPPRRAGVEIRLYEVDPYIVAAGAEASGGRILQPPTDKPHGLRETYILDPNGYAWVPSCPL